MYTHVSFLMASRAPEKNLNKCHLWWASEPPTATTVIMLDPIIFTSSDLNQKIFTSATFDSPSRHSWSSSPCSTRPDHSTLAWGRKTFLKILNFFLHVLLIACGLLPSLAITFVVYVFQAAGVLQVLMPLLGFIVVFIVMVFIVVVFIVVVVITIITPNFWLELVDTCLLGGNLSLLSF